MAIVAALVAVLGQVAALPVGPVPITLQTMGVMLTGAILGPWRGVGVTYACGVPVMAYQLDISLQEAVGVNLIFLPGDGLKAAMAVVITHSPARAYPSAFARRRGPGRK